MKVQNKIGKMSPFDQNSSLGQVWTPRDISLRMVRLSSKFRDNKLHIVLDPGCGPATFEKALIESKIIPKKIIPLPANAEKK